MWKKLLPLLVSVVVIGGAVFLYRHRHLLFRPNFARSGGVVLVYQVDGAASGDDVDQAVQVVQKRFDPTGALGLLISRNADNEIEIRVPATDKLTGQVEQIKRLIAKPGKMEIHILPRQTDDEEVFRDVTAALAHPGARDKVPPPLPKGEDKNSATAKLGGEKEYRYHWTRVSQHELQHLRLDPATLPHSGPSDLPRVQEGLAKGEAITGFDQAPNQLFAVRKVAGDPNPVFFVLTREEPARGQLTSDHLERTKAAEDPMMRRPGIALRFKPDGGERLYSIMSRNLTIGFTPDRMSKLAVILDGEVIGCPLIMNPSRKELIVPGNFTKAQAEDFAVLLRGGTLPVKLKPDPIRENTIDKK